MPVEIRIQEDMRVLSKPSALLTRSNYLFFCLLLNKNRLLEKYFIPKKYLLCIFSTKYAYRIIYVPQKNSTPKKNKSFCIAIDILQNKFLLRYRLRIRNKLKQSNGAPWKIQLPHGLNAKSVTIKHIIIFTNVVSKEMHI